MWKDGSSTKDIQSKLFEDNDITLRRARLIARDQIGKLNAEITEKRHKELGVTEYIWDAAMDERTRGNPTGLYPNAKYSHWDREGKVFKYSDPPEDGPPGYSYQCRCVAIPKLPEELD
jgi:SPP1 gp7 family putative phage head morphogenesis protein